MGAQAEGDDPPRPRAGPGNGIPKVEKERSGIMLKTEYKYIVFKFTDAADHKKGAECLNKKSGTILGYVEYYTPWKQYVIEFREDFVFNVSCLKDIADFLRQLNNEDA